MKIEHIKVEDYYMPNIKPIERIDLSKIGKYGRLRLKYLKDYQIIQYTNLLLNNELQRHLVDLNKQVNNSINLLVTKLAENENVDKKLKETDQIKWLSLMNNIKNCAEEIVLNELIYV